MEGVTISAEKQAANEFARDCDLDIPIDDGAKDAIRWLLSQAFIAGAQYNPIECKKCESKLGAIHHLREMAQELADKYRKSCPSDCHCEVCHMDHALSATCGFAEKEYIEI